MEKIYCPKCGHENEDIAAACTRCGETLGVNQESIPTGEADPREKKDKGGKHSGELILMWAGFGVVILLTLILIWFMFGGRH